MPLTLPRRVPRGGRVDLFGGVAAPRLDRARRLCESRCPSLVSPRPRRRSAHAPPRGPRGGWWPSPPRSARRCPAPAPVRLEIGAFDGGRSTGPGRARSGRTSTRRRPTDDVLSFYYRVARPGSRLVAAPRVARATSCSPGARAPPCAAAWACSWAGRKAGEVLVGTGPWARYDVRSRRSWRGAGCDATLALRPLPLVTGDHAGNPEVLVDFVEMRGAARPAADCGGRAWSSASCPRPCSRSPGSVGHGPRRPRAAGVAAAPGHGRARARGRAARRGRGACGWCPSPCWPALACHALLRRASLVSRRDRAPASPGWSRSAIAVPRRPAFLPEPQPAGPGDARHAHARPGARAPRAAGPAPLRLAPAHALAGGRAGLATCSARAR